MQSGSALRSAGRWRQAPKNPYIPLIQHAAGLFVPPFSVAFYFYSSPLPVCSTSVLPSQNSHSGKVNIMSEMHKGSCLCGTVKFEVIGSFQKFFFCHCSYCRKGTGSAHASNLFAFDSEYKCTSGKEAIRSYSVPSSRHAKSFCNECGSPVPTHFEEAGFLMVPAGSLETPVHINPTAHIFEGSKANWDDHLENVVKYDELPK